MNDEEVQKEQRGNFNPFWKVGEQKANVPVNFKVISEDIVVKKIPSIYAGGKEVDNMCIEIENLETRKS